MLRITTLLLILVAISSCSNKKTETEPLTAEHKAKIVGLSKDLIKSINDFDFSIVNSTWSNKAFKDRVSNITGTQKSVFEHIFEKDLKRKIKTGNLSIIHHINSTNGAASFFNLDHKDHHSELTILLTYNDNFNFFKYRIEIENQKPVLSDSYNFRDNLWYSEKIINSLRLASKHNAFSNDRRETNIAIHNSDQELLKGDTLEALYYLYDIPTTHQTGNWLSFRKLTLAQSLSDSVYASVMVTEYENNKSLYMKYLYHLYFSDSTDLEKVYDILSEELGESKTLDSLVSSGSFWD
ncbi:hypothetical protein [Reichenbachiella sp.]|uniref:hypothetical protein n=1 Tax=Reichenbachiella sp. TaxID=2184521 RepID=UPI003B59FC19